MVIVKEVYRDDFQASVGIFPANSLEDRFLVRARRAIYPPEIQDHHLAPQSPQIHDGSIEVPEHHSICDAGSSIQIEVAKLQRMRQGIGNSSVKTTADQEKGGKQNTARPESILRH
jgi:hypothetical protein